MTIQEAVSSPLGDREVNIQQVYLDQEGDLPVLGKISLWKKKKLITQQRPFSAGQIQSSFYKREGCREICKPWNVSERSVPCKRFCSTCILEIIGFSKAAHNRNHWTMGLSSSPGLSLIGLNNLTPKSFFATQQKPEAFVLRTAGRTGGGSLGVSVLPREFRYMEFQPSLISQMAAKETS